MSNLVTPVLMVMVAGLVASALLVIASKVFYVPVHERVTAITEALPGANCGGCGFAGCGDYANSLVENPDLPCNKCAPGGAACAEAIAKILGKSAGATEPQVAQVMCNGTCGATTPILEWQGLQSCKGAKGFFTTPSACMQGCIGLGDCVNACQFDAIGVIDGRAVVNRTNCVACGACVGTCPQSIIKLVPLKAQVHVMCSNTDKAPVAMKACKNACIGCGKCAKACNFGAITVENFNATIDPDKCKSCGMCVVECPTGAINTYKVLTAAQAEKFKAANKAKAEKAKKAAEEAKAAAATEA